MSPLHNWQKIKRHWLFALHLTGAPLWSSPCMISHDRGKNSHLGKQKVIVVNHFNEAWQHHCPFLTHSKGAWWTQTRLVINCVCGTLYLAPQRCSVPSASASCWPRMPWKLETGLGMRTVNEGRKQEMGDVTRPPEGSNHVLSGFPTELQNEQGCMHLSRPRSSLRRWRSCSSLFPPRLASLLPPITITSQALTPSPRRRQKR